MGQEIGGFIKDFGEPISIGTTALGGVLGAVGKVKTGNALEDKSVFEAAVLRNNKLIADTASKQALREGEELRQDRQVQTAQLIGQQRASFAGRGVVVDDPGGSLDLLIDAVRIGKLDEVAIQTNAEREALALKMQGASFGIRADQALRAGDAAREAGLFGAAGTLLKTAGKVATKWAVFGRRNEGTALEQRTT